MTDQGRAGPDVPPTGAGLVSDVSNRDVSNSGVSNIDVPVVEAPSARIAPEAPRAPRAAPVRRRIPLPDFSRGLTRPLAVLKRHRALAAGLALGVALGGATGAGAVVALKRPDGPSAADFHRLVQRIEDNGAARLAAEVKGLREQVAVLKDSAERGRGDSGGRINQIGERLEKLQRTEQEVAKGVAALAERVERADRDEAQRLAALGDRIEKRLAAASQAPAPQAAAQVAQPAAAKPADPVMTGAIPGATPPAVVTSWTVREVYDGIAMLENRNQRLLEVAPGSTVPGVGRVEAIERRGKAWVVVTSKGVITAQAW